MLKNMFLTDTKEHEVYAMALHMNEARLTELFGKDVARSLTIKLIRTYFV